MTQRVQIKVISVSRVSMNPFRFPSPRQSGVWIAAASGHCIVIRGVLLTAKNEAVADCPSMMESLLEISPVPDSLVLQSSGFGLN